MSSEFLLPCSCGLKHRVSTQQAGEAIVCSCGQRVEVPTLRALRQLEPAPPTSTAAAKPEWGLRQGLIFLGLLLLLVGGGAAGTLYGFVLPGQHTFETKQDQIDALTPSEAWRFWSLVQHGIPEQPTTDVVDVLVRTDFARRWIKVGLAGGAVGLLILASSLLVSPTPARN